MDKPDIKLEFAECRAEENENFANDNKIISTQIQRLEIRLERVKIAYEDGVDTIEEYKENKNNILAEIDKLKNMLDVQPKEIPKAETNIEQTEIRRLTDILCDETISNVEKKQGCKDGFQGNYQRRRKRQDDQMRILEVKNTYSNFCRTAEYMATV